MVYVCTCTYKVASNDISDSKADTVIGKFARHGLLASSPVSPRELFLPQLKGGVARAPPTPKHVRGGFIFEVADVIVACDGNLEAHLALRGAVGGFYSSPHQPEALTRASLDGAVVGAINVQVQVRIDYKRGKKRAIKIYFSPKAHPPPQASTNYFH